MMKVTRIKLDFNTHAGLKYNKVALEKRVKGIIFNGSFEQGLSGRLRISTLSIL